jgi:transcriptional regulator with XRE-family HTH domain
MTPAELQRARRALGWSQSRLAEALGYKLRHVQRLEAGDSPIPKAVGLAMHSLAVRYGVLR